MASQEKQATIGPEAKGLTIASKNECTVDDAEFTAMPNTVLAHGGWSRNVLNLDASSDKIFCLTWPPESVIASREILSSTLGGGGG